MAPSVRKLFPSSSRQVTPGLGNAEGGAFSPRVLGVRHPALLRPQPVAQPPPWRSGVRGGNDVEGRDPKGSKLGLVSGGEWRPPLVRAAAPAALQTATTSQRQEPWGWPPAGPQPGPPLPALLGLAGEREVGRRVSQKQPVPGDTQARVPLPPTCSALGQVSFRLCAPGGLDVATRQPSAQPSTQPRAEQRKHHNRKRKKKKLSRFFLFPVSAPGNSSTSVLFIAPKAPDGSRYSAGLSGGGWQETGPFDKSFLPVQVY